MSTVRAKHGFMPRLFPHFPLLGVSLLVMLLDQLSKQVALAQLTPHHLVKVMPYFDWYLTFNRGAAFSFLAQAGGWQRWFFTITTVIISTVILVWMKNLPRSDRGTAIGLSLILGGAIGNLIDRVYLGYVIDFIQVWIGSYPWPAFNLADAAISVGAVVLILGNFTGNQKTAAKPG